MKKVKNEVAIVAGGSGGMGRAVVKKLLDEGAKVVSADLDIPKKRINNNNLIYYKLDSTKQDSWNKTVKIAIKNFKKISILVNCFGSNFRREFEEQNLEEWKKILDVNLTGVFIGIKTVAPLMKKGNKGSIVNFGSIVTLKGGRNGPAYQASKTGLIGLTKSTALSFSEYNIRCNLICPGHVDTDFIRENNSYSPNDWSTSIQNPKNYEERKSQIPLKNFQETTDVANLTLFLSSDDSKMITGSIIPIDGGSSI